MEELIYLLIRAIVRSMGPGKKQDSELPSWQQQIRRRQQQLQRATLQGMLSAPPPPPRRRMKKAAQAEEVQRVEVAATRAVDVSSEAAPSASAPGLNRLLTPTLLRRQFILAEILRPPVALREPS